jgi:hypothetical protein
MLVNTDTVFCSFTQVSVVGISGPGHIIVVCEIRTGWLSREHLCFVTNIFSRIPLVGNLDQNNATTTLYSKGFEKSGQRVISHWLQNTPSVTGCISNRACPSAGQENTEPRRWKTTLATVQNWFSASSGSTRTNRVYLNETRSFFDQTSQAYRLEYRLYKLLWVICASCRIKSNGVLNNR